MPNVDGGHYFLSTLIPVCLGPVARADGSVTVPSQLLREALATLPTAQQSPAAVTAGFVSPFSRCTRTHFARFVVIDQPRFNGRDGGDALKQSLRRVNLLAHQPVDCLSRPYLMFTADFDARPDEPDQGLASWAERAWAKMEPELRAIFSACVGFDQVTSGPAFTTWLKRCQIESKMTFNDYYVPDPTLPGYTLEQVAIGIAVATLGLGALSSWAIMRCGSSLAWLLLALPLGLLVAIVGALWVLWVTGRRPFPTGADTDLPSVLKALHVQQCFALLAARLQGADAAAIHEGFGAFVSAVQPASVDAPTQSPGVVRSDDVPLIQHTRVRPKEPGK